MEVQTLETDPALVQASLELRHDVEVLAVKCRRMYEEANAIVERLRSLDALAQADAQPPPPKPRVPSA